MRDVQDMYALEADVGGMGHITTHSAAILHQTRS